MRLRRRPTPLRRPSLADRRAVPLAPHVSRLEVIEGGSFFRQLWGARGAADTGEGRI